MKHSCSGGQDLKSVALLGVGNAAIQALLARALELKGQKQQVAHAIGVKPSRFSKLLHQKRGAEAPNVANCFRLATLLGEPPQIVLRAAGQADVADAMDDYALTVKSGSHRPTAPRQDPLVLGVAEVLPVATAEDVAMLRGMVNLIRKGLGLPAIELPTGRKRAARRPA
jgi:hypothetical protein